ncbi:4-hydroxy-3-methylbut-2-enyl diphosphate reductase [Desulfohalobium retbaense]|uniref:4-hydroxy-3-methylbut-2-enyl diphosphate reductase n=1 Tax=Desulfohalobium retbaense (strain ATCC 49708 / DSM 5692 / JCM 16813 / HR100) TaxID=485915 RepID=C8X243_DESRD|nr:4-hydroxy-3-methylbut-2-enyl diphosphate reductase [Desulfohalobium retbaense]ACV68366.1 hydroxymethylbutenyl pyrophosphate reductase [Desulfohalobium retbaense DSM 5692]
MTEVLRAETAGFCMGVDLALRKLNSQVEAKDTSPIFTFGPIIHNPQVLAHYAARGVTESESPSTIPAQSRAVIRAHGIPRLLEDQLRSKGVTLVDATCPKVKKAQLLIEKQTKQGRHLLLFGESDHPEVKGLLSYADAEALVFDSLLQLQGKDLAPEKRYFLASQTTQDREEFRTIRDYLLEHVDASMPIFDTICDATRERQVEAKRIAKQVDYMIVVGGLTSGNTRRLAQVITAQGTPCAHIEQADELPLPALTGVQRIGLTAGASTPKYIIDAVENRLREL